MTQSKNVVDNNIARNEIIQKLIDNPELPQIEDAYGKAKTVGSVQFSWRSDADTFFQRGLEYLVAAQHIPVLQAEHAKEQDENFLTSLKALQALGYYNLVWKASLDGGEKGTLSAWDKATNNLRTPRGYAETFVKRMEKWLASPDVLEVLDYRAKTYPWSVPIEETGRNLVALVLYWQKEYAKHKEEKAQEAEASELLLLAKGDYRYTRRDVLSKEIFGIQSPWYESKITPVRAYIDKLIDAEIAAGKHL